MRRSAACLVWCVLVGCGGGPGAESRQISSEVEAQVAAARNATIPSGISLTDGSGPTREDSLVSAQWSFELQGDWEGYASQTGASLQQAGYEVVSSGADARALAKHVPGDSYRVRIAGQGLPSAIRVTVSFSASPD